MSTTEQQVTAESAGRDVEQRYYRHYRKGHVYELLFSGRLEWCGLPCNIYRRADGSDPQVWVRPVSLGPGAWCDEVENEAGEGVQRFTPLTPEEVAAFLVTLSGQAPG